MSDVPRRSCRSVGAPEARSPCRPSDPPRRRRRSPRATGRRHADRPDRTADPDRRRPRRRPCAHPRAAWRRGRPRRSPPSRAPMAVARGVRSFRIWAASSRVGTSTNADGWRRPRRPAWDLASSRDNTASPNASVLPDPVGAMPHTSRPARRVGKGRGLDREGRRDASVLQRPIQSIRHAEIMEARSARGRRGSERCSHKTPVGPRKGRWPTRSCLVGPADSDLSAAAGIEPRGIACSITDVAARQRHPHSIALGGAQLSAVGLYPSSKRRGSGPGVCRSPPPGFPERRVPVPNKHVSVVR